MSYENAEISKLRSRYLRQHQTEEENYLWRNYLRDCGWKFRRQFVVDPYIVDFYCVKLGLAIELDGAYHHDEEVEAYDKRRTAYLNKKGVRVLRIDNAMIQKEFMIAVFIIEEEIKEILAENPQIISPSNIKTLE